MCPRSAADGLAADLRDVRVLIGERNSVYARAVVLLESLVEGPDAAPEIVAGLAQVWRDHTFRSFYERPLLLLASMRSDSLDDRAHPLRDAFAGSPPELAAVTREALASALAPERRATWSKLASRKVQTNDVSRAITWRLPSLAVGERPIVLVDIGCSAGLNLVADALPPPWKDREGNALVPAGRAKVIERSGFDVDPIDVRHVDESAWLRACVWPGDHARLDRLDEAVEVMVSAWRGADAPRLWSVAARDVPARLRAVEARAPEGAFVLAYQSFLRDYLERDEASVYDAGMTAWLEALPRGRGMWAELELAQKDGEHPAELVAHVKTPTGMRALRLGRTSYHPSVVDVDRAAFAELAAALAL